MRPASIELCEPPIKIGLQLCDRAVELFAEGDAIEIVQMVLWNRPKIPLVRGLLVFVRE
jgi:hypothetical protein